MENLLRDPNQETNYRQLKHALCHMFVMGVVWLIIATVLKIAALISANYDNSWLFNYALLQATSNQIIIYGWALPSVAAIGIYLACQFSELNKIKGGIFIYVLSAIWNTLVVVGSVLILFFEEATGKISMQYPFYIAAGFFIIMVLLALYGSYLMIYGRSNLVNLSKKYLIASTIWSIVIYGSAYTAVTYSKQAPLFATTVNFWFHSGVIFLMLLPLCLAMVYTILRRIIPQEKNNLGNMAFWMLSFLAPWLGLEKIIGSPIPLFMQYMSVTATLLFPMIALITFYQWSAFIKRQGDALFKYPEIRFIFGGGIAFLFYTVVQFFAALPPFVGKFQFTLLSVNSHLFVLYGVIGFFVFAGIYYIVPEITNKEWVSSRLMKWHFTQWGIAMSILGLFGLLMAGLTHGEINDSITVQSWQTVSDYFYFYDWLVVITLMIVLPSLVLLLLHLLLMWLGLGRYTSYPTLIEANHAHAVHGKDSIEEPTI